MAETPGRRSEQQLRTFCGRGANPVDASGKAHALWGEWMVQNAPVPPMKIVSTAATDSEDGAFFILTVLFEEEKKNG